jgi:Poxvirus A32 protein
MPFDCRLSHPFNLLVSGPSKSGKTTFVSNLLKTSEDMFHTKPKYILLYYANDQPLYQELYRSKLINEMINFNDAEPNYQEIYDKVEPFKNDNGSLIIFDDTLSDIKPGFEKIFQVLGHHTNCSLIYLSQNLFYNSKTFRNLSLQLDYIVLMRNQRDASQIRSLSTQLCPGNPQYITEAYRKATQQPFTYLFVDCGANSLKELRLRSHIFPHESPYCVYLEK